MRSSRLWWDAVKHAFAVEKPGPAEPTPEQALLVDRLCREVIRRRLATPALVALEMSRPLNFVTAQAIHFFDPILRTFSDLNAPREFAKFLEKRGSIEYVVQRLDDMTVENIPPESDTKFSPPG